MKTRNLEILGLGALLLLPISRGNASTTASFLKLGIGARASALGSAYTAISDDVTALYWNPAGLSQISKREAGAMHSEMFANTRYDFIGYAHPTKAINFGIGAAYLSQGSLEGRAADRSKVDDFSANDLAVTLGASRFALSNLSLGANIKLIQSRISGYTATGFALDLGTVFKPEMLEKLSLGMAVQNIGPQMKFASQSSNLPMTLAGGASYQIIKSVLISSDLRQSVYDSKTDFSAGIEFVPTSLLSLRAGYLTNGVRSYLSNQRDISDQIAAVSGLGLGLGIKMGLGTLDYSFTPAGELGNTQRVSISAKF